MKCWPLKCIDNGKVNDQDMKDMIENKDAFLEEK